MQTTIYPHIEQLNARARELYIERAKTATEEPDRFAVLRTCFDQVASESGLTILADSGEDAMSGSHTRIYENEAGEIVNCWIGCEIEEISQTDFSGLGFDDQIEWFTDAE